MTITFGQTLRIGIAVAILLAGAFPTLAQQGPQKIRVAYLRTLGNMHLFQADKMGAFKKEGIEVEQIVLNNGPAVASAIASGSADIGFAAATPMITAISQNQPFKAFITNNTEKYPSQWVQSIVVADTSPVRSISDIKGKTVIINGVGTACELHVRAHLAQVGMKYEDVKTVMLPFPQHAAAMERGDGNASCNVEPFLSIMKLGKLKVRSIADGVLGGMDKLGEVVIDGYFARGDWLAKNPKAAAAFKRGLEAADAHYDKNVADYRAMLAAEFKLPPDVVAAIQPEIKRRKLDAKADQWQPVLDAMAKFGMIARPIKAGDIIFPLPE